jgi:hypothetical protein
VRPSTPLPFAFLAALLVATSSAQPVRADPPPPPAAPLATAAPPPPEDGTRALRFTGGVSLTGLGLLTAVVGGVVAARAAVSKRDIGSHCNAAGYCDLVGYSLASEAVDFSATATALIPTGLAIAAAGAGLLLSTQPWRPRVTAGIAPTAGGMVVTGVARW